MKYKKTGGSIMNNLNLLGNLTLTKLNALIANCPGKADLRLRENPENESGLLDVYWTSYTGLKANYFILTAEDVGSEDISDRVYIRYYVVKDGLSGKKSLYFDMSLSTEFTRRDLEELYDNAVCLLDEVGVGEYSLMDLNSAINKKFFTQDEAEAFVKSVNKCQEPVCCCLPDMLPEITTMEECEEFVNSGEVNYYLPNQLIFEKTDGQFNYNFINGDSGVHFLVSGKNSDGTGTDLIKVGIMERIHIYKSRLRSLVELVKGKDEYAKGIVEHLPTFSKNK